MNDLAAEIVACLRVNLLRGALMTQDDAEFEKTINAWSDRAVGDVMVSKASVKPLVDALNLVSASHLPIDAAGNHPAHAWISRETAQAVWKALAHAKEIGLTEDKP